LVVSITLAVLILMTVVYVREPVKFSVFPSILLMTTAYRLALNVAVTRQVLGNAGQEGTRAAGRVVEAFGNFVASADPVIGFVIFVILIIVNFIVITKGAGRVSEVAARFTLDAMPGKQMAIDADLNAGLIKEAEARDRRKQVAREALWITMGFLGLLLCSAIFMGSGLPWFQLLVVGGFLAVAASVMGSTQKKQAKAESEKKEQEAVAARKPEKVEGLLKVDAMEL